MEAARSPEAGGPSPPCALPSPPPSCRKVPANITRQGRPKAALVLPHRAEALGQSHPRASALATPVTERLRLPFLDLGCRPPEQHCEDEQGQQSENDCPLPPKTGNCSLTFAVRGRLVRQRTDVACPWIPRLSRARCLQPLRSQWNRPARKQEPMERSSIPLLRPARMAKLALALMARHSPPPPATARWSRATATATKRAAPAARFAR